MTQLKINNSYPTDTGFLIPRSHLGGDDNNPFCVVDLLILGRVDCYIKVTKTMTRKELKQELHLSKTERIEIV
jgi:hypothetical protein